LDKNRAISQIFIFSFALKTAKACLLYPTNRQALAVLLGVLPPSVFSAAAAPIFQKGFFCFEIWLTLPIKLLKMVVTAIQEEIILSPSLVGRNGKDGILEPPKTLIYEEFGGRVYYRKGYKSVLNQTKKLTDIMGTSSLQGIIISVLLRYLFTHTGEDEYEIITNEAGLHVSRGENFSSDIILYNAEDARKYRYNEYYFNVAPKVVIEVDIKIELENQTDMEYVKEKTEKLLKFGVEHIIWVLSKERIVIIAEPNQDLVIKNWTKDFDLLPNHTINIQKMIEKKGYQFNF
jgi:Uma2 family endonuclease